MALSTEHRIHILLLLVIVVLLLGRYVPKPGIDMRSLYERFGIEWTESQPAARQAPTPAQPDFPALKPGKYYAVSEDTLLASTLYGESASGSLPACESFKVLLSFDPGDDEGDVWYEVEVDYAGVLESRYINASSLSGEIVWEGEKAPMVAFKMVLPISPELQNDAVER